MDMWPNKRYLWPTVTLLSSAFQGIKWFYALEWKCLRANIESTKENALRVFSKCLIGGHCLTGGCLGAGDNDDYTKLQGNHSTTVAVWFNAASVWMYTELVRNHPACTLVLGQCESQPAFDTVETWQIRGLCQLPYISHIGRVSSFSVLQPT